MFGRSESQNTVTIHQRCPSFNSWMLLMPRANGVGSSARRRDSYVLNRCVTPPKLGDAADLALEEPVLEPAGAGNVLFDSHHPGRD